MNFFKILNIVNMDIVDGFKRGYGPKVDMLIFDIHNRENLSTSHQLAVEISSCFEVSHPKKSKFWQNLSS